MFGNRREKGKDFQATSVERVKKAVRKNTVCYVLITCTKPTKDGKMEVEMSYEGDEALAAYLVESAQSVFEGRIEESINSSSK